MNNNLLKTYLDFATKLSHQAGDIMLRYHKADSLDTQWKPDHSPVTIADTTINKLVIDSVKTAYPDHGIIGEEESYHPDRRNVWIVDPVDGTAPYDLGMQASTFCLSFVTDGEVQVALILDPFANTLCTAMRGSGTKVNGKTINIKPINNFAHTYVFAPAASESKPDQFLPLQAQLRSAGAKIIVIPSISYMATFILEGKMLSAYMSYGSPWDAAAIALIIEEAGGRATDLRGESRKWNEWGDGLLLSNGAVHNQMVEWLALCES